jgi:transcriptional regulator with XRE-family HTH domain
LRVLRPATDVSRSSVSLVEGGREKPSKRYRKAASRVLGVPEDLLFGDDDLPF